MNRLMLALAALIAVGCTDDDTARRALRQQGYTEIILTGYDWLGCSKHDTFHTGFRAVSASGSPVEGVVCSGIFKGNTIRTF